MAPNFSKSAVFSGTVDYFCLVCETHLKSEEDTVNHISKPVHKKSFSATSYVEKFEMDMIRKVKLGYFCELCNCLLRTLARVKVHVKDPNHDQNKTCRIVFQRVGNLVIADHVAIPENSWNGLIENTCVICNEEYEDVNMHKSQTSHIINLVQAKEIVDGENIYRRFDDTSVHCLTCNVILTVDTMNDHFINTEHKKMHLSCQDVKKRVKTINSEAEIADGNGKNDNVTTSSEVADKNEVKKAAESKERDEKSDKKEFQKLAKENNFTFKIDTNTAYCDSCEANIPNLKLMKQHISSKIHKRNVSVVNKDVDVILKKVALKEFITELTHVETLFFANIVINNKFCLSILGFLIVTALREDVFRCQICEITNHRSDINSHLSSHSHKEKHENLNVIINYEQEFIREVRPDVYHCGFCNLLISSWKNVKRHLNSIDHRDRKNVANHRLEIHRPGLRQHQLNRLQEAFASRIFMNMFN